MVTGPRRLQDGDGLVDVGSQQCGELVASFGAVEGATALPMSAWFASSRSRVAGSAGESVANATTVDQVHSMHDTRRRLRARLAAQGLLGPTQEVTP